jgi:hypothetical protein
MGAIGNGTRLSSHDYSVDAALTRVARETWPRATVVYGGAWCTGWLLYETGSIESAPELLGKTPDDAWVRLKSEAWTHRLLQSSTPDDREYADELTERYREWAGEYAPLKVGISRRVEKLWIDTYGEDYRINPFAALLDPKHDNIVAGLVSDETPAVQALTILMLGEWLEFLGYTEMAKDDFRWFRRAARRSAGATDAVDRISVRFREVEREWGNGQFGPPFLRRLRSLTPVGL